jgi:hypothetical protein
VWEVSSPVCAAHAVIFPVASHPAPQHVVYIEDTEDQLRWLQCTRSSVSCHYAVCFLTLIPSLLPLSGRVETGHSRTDSKSLTRTIMAMHNDGYEAKGFLSSVIQEELYGLRRSLKPRKPSIVCQVLRVIVTTGLVILIFFLGRLSAAPSGVKGENFLYCKHLQNLWPGFS